MLRQAWVRQASFCVLKSRNQNRNWKYEVTVFMLSFPPEGADHTDAGPLANCIDERTGAT